MKVRQRLARRLDSPRTRRRLATARRLRRRWVGTIWRLAVYPLNWYAPLRVSVAPAPEVAADAHLSGLLREGAL